MSWFDRLTPRGQRVFAWLAVLVFVALCALAGQGPS